MNKIFIISLLIMLICTFVVVPTPESSSQPDQPKIITPVVPVVNEADKNAIKLDSMVDITVNKTAIIKKQNEEIRMLLIEKGKTRAASSAVAKGKITTKIDTCIVVVKTPVSSTTIKNRPNFFKRIFR